MIALIGRSPASFEAQASVFLPLAVLVSLTYLVLAVRYWFRTPIIGILLASVCFLASWVLFVRTLSAVVRSEGADHETRSLLLGGGVRLLPEPAERAKLKLTRHRVYAKTGTVALEYDVT